MKRAIFAILFVFLLSAPLSDGAVADQPNTQSVAIHDVITEMEDSVLLIVGITEDMKPFKGTGVVVRADKDRVIILTAKHVSSGGEIMVAHNGNLYSPINKLPLGTTDVCLLFMPPMQGVKALKPNLDKDSGHARSVALGYWGRLEELTATAGRTNRLVISEYFNNHEVVSGVIRSSGMLYFGYSGGALIDTSGRLLGINIALTNEFTIAVDIRYIWNQYAVLNEGKKVTFESDKNYNQLKTGSNDWTRIESDFDATITDDNGESISVLDLRVLCGKEVTEPGLIISDDITRWLTSGFTFTSDGKKYKIIGWEIGMRNKLRVKDGEPSFKMDYAFIFANGYYILLALEEIDAAE